MGSGYGSRALPAAGRHPDHPLWSDGDQPGSFWTNAQTEGTTLRGCPRHGWPARSIGSRRRRDGAFRRVQRKQTRKGACRGVQAQPGWRISLVDQAGEPRNHRGVQPRLQPNVQPASRSSPRSASCSTAPFKPTFSFALNALFKPAFIPPSTPRSATRSIPLQLRVQRPVHHTLSPPQDPLATVLRGVLRAFGGAGPGDVQPGGRPGAVA